MQITIEKLENADTITFKVLDDISQRMVNYDKQTKPLLDFYKKKYKELIHHVDANKDVKEIFSQADEILSFFI